MNPNARIHVSWSFNWGVFSTLMTVIHSQHLPPCVCDVFHIVCLCNSIEGLSWPFFGLSLKLLCPLKKPNTNPAFLGVPGSDGFIPTPSLYGLIYFHIAALSSMPVFHSTSSVLLLQPGEMHSSVPGINHHNVWDKMFCPRARLDRDWTRPSALMERPAYCMS